MTLHECAKYLSDLTRETDSRAAARAIGAIDEYFASIPRGNKAADREALLTAFSDSEPSDTEVADAIRAELRK